MTESSRPVLASESHDPLSRMRVYRLAIALLTDCWLDVEKLAAHSSTQKLSGQLYAAVGSIAANIVEGYSRSSGKDRARFFEYALGSVRESMVWFKASETIVGSERVTPCLNTLEEMRRLLLAIIPKERERRIGPSR